MRKLVRNAALTAAAAATAIGLTATPALASGPWNTVPGTFTATNANTLFAQDIETGASVTCDTGSATGELFAGPFPHPPDPRVAELDSFSLGDSSTPDGNCVGPGSLTVAIDPIGLPWGFHPQSEDASHVVTGELRDVKAQITDSSGCVAQITGPGGGPGTLEGRYDNNTGQMWVTGGNLEVESINGQPPCDPTIINDGDHIFMDGTFQLSPTASIHHNH